MWRLQVFKQKLQVMVPFFIAGLTKGQAKKVKSANQVLI